MSGAEDPTPDDRPPQDRPPEDRVAEEPASDVADPGIGTEPGASEGAPGKEELQAIVGDLSLDELAAELMSTAAQRDEFREALQRMQADFENYRKRVTKQQADAAERTAEGLVDSLLPILDACDGAIRHEASEVEPIYAALLGTLEKSGLERIDPHGETFDPTRHEAVLHEPGDEAGTEPVVSDVMRPGYAWKGKVIRPAMVKVSG